MEELNFSKLEGFEWDKGNKQKNWNKHKIYYKEIEEIFFNKPLVIIPDKKHSKIEQRFVCYGITKLGRKLSVIFTWRGKKIRVISARSQNRKERNEYEKN